MEKGAKERGGIIVKRSVCVLQQATNSRVFRHFLIKTGGYIKLQKTKQFSLTDQCVHAGEKHGGREYLLLVSGPHLFHTPSLRSQ